jgi:hypothetical protein
MKKIKIIFVLLAAAVLSAAAYADDFSARVNIALEDGTIMIYAGTKQGVNVGDEFDVFRSGAKVGHIKVLRVKELFSYCEIADGTAQEMDIVKRTYSAPAAAGGESVTEKPKTSEEGSTSTAVASANASAEDTSGGSKRRDRAKKELDETATSSQPVGTTAEKTTEKEQKTGEKGQKALPSFGSAHTAAFGLTGALFIPTANIGQKSSGTGLFYYSSSSEESNDFKNTGIGYSHTSGDTEAAFMYIKSDITSNAVDSVSGNTTAFSFKFQFPQTKPPTFLKTLENIRYAAGIQYFSENTKDSSGVKTGGKASRFFAVASTEIMRGTGSFGLYAQNGDMITDTDYKGMGFMGSFEYPLGFGTKNGQEQMTLILEGDTKAFYLGTYRTLSVGLRYAFSENGHIALSMADVGSTNTIALTGGYSFR